MIPSNDWAADQVIETEKLIYSNRAVKNSNITVNHLFIKVLRRCIIIARNYQYHSTSYNLVNDGYKTSEQQF